jgi:hypothetical protein
MDILSIIFIGIALMLAAVVLVQGIQLKQVHAKLKEMEGKPKPLKINEPTAAQLEAQLTAAYQSKIAEATETFGTDLQATSQRLSEQVSRLTTTVIEEELEAYQKILEQVRQTATQAMDQIHQAVENQRIELREGMEAELAAEKKMLADKFDAKFGDVVSSYISESLGSGVDLGAQMQFILTSLESHKEEIRKDLLNGV